MWGYLSKMDEWQMQRRLPNSAVPSELRQSVSVFPRLKPWAIGGCPSRATRGAREEVGSSEPEV